jgi:cytochrome bd-type quinol oxidase subunit 1
MNEASSDAMKTIALASSSERPRRPIGTVVTRAALFSGVPVKRVNMPVSVGPGADSLHGQIPGPKQFAPQDRPNSTIVFWTFRLMVGLGLLMVLLGVWSLWLRWRG